MSRVYHTHIPEKYRSAGAVWLLLLLLSTAGHAQTDRVRQEADRYFYAHDYPSAAREYGEILKDNSLDAGQRREVLLNLGRTYLALQDHVKAERQFRELLALGEPLGDEQVVYLYYAQALGQNGKIEQAQEMYDRYQEVLPQLSTTSSVWSRLPGPKEGKTVYRVERLGINTDGAEFSPAFFREGLVFVAGEGSGVATGSPDKGYLDLLYVPDRSDLSVVGRMGADGKLVAVPAAGGTSGAGGMSNRRLGRDSYTRTTPNDSRTAASFAPMRFRAAWA